MNKSRVVSLLVVVLLCAALVLASSPAAAAARPSAKATAAKANAAVSSAMAQGRSTFEVRAAAGKAALRDGLQWLRTLPESASRCAQQAGATLAQSVAGARRGLAARAGASCQCVRACAARVASAACQLSQRVCRAARAVSTRIAAAVPDSVKPFAQDVINGACSVVLVRHHFNAQAAGNIPDSPASRSDAIWSYTTAKFLYGLSAGLTELCLLRVLYREPHGNHRTNRCNRFFASLLGWPLLVAMVALPNGLVEAGMLVVMVLKLSPSSFRPAITVGHLIRPYVVATLLTCPCIARLAAAYTSLWPAKVVPVSPAVAAAAEVLLWAIVMWALMFLVASTRKASGEEAIVLDSASDASSEEAEEQAEEEAPAAAASKPRAGKAPRAKAAASKPRKSTRSSSRR